MNSGDWRQLALPRRRLPPILSRSSLRIGAATSAALFLCAAAPGEMSVAAFLARADALMPLGPLAIATPEGHRLKGEVIAAGKRYKARIDAQRRAGRPTTSCPPESGTLSPDEWLAHLRSYPASQRPRISISVAFDGLMRKRYPCPR
ncbi:hypothetical protein [Sphingopyxis sp. MWB1]|uniref:hypothetical protein n=1 Tax=Sphingopyxis sp. MWB1 TaxID=1537715 RepID=UPI000B2679CE|nr:hypothetical protein [Sphingopyxis sp. MWB1]